MQHLRALILIAVTSASLACAAQEAVPAASPGTLSVEAKLVVVPTVVRDKHGALVPNLSKDDFTLQVDGKPQTIRYFDHDTDVPLTLGLLIDTSQSQRDVLDDERSASGSFLQTMLAPATGKRDADKAFIVQFAHTVDLLQDVTDSRPKLQKALKEVDTTTTAQDSSDPDTRPADNSGSSDRGGYGHHRGSGGGGTALYDSVFLASDEIVAKQKGRRALILLTDGVDRGSKESLASSIEAAQRTDAILYAIYFKGADHGFGGGHGGGFPGGGFPGGGGGRGGGGGGGGYPGGGGGGGSRGGGGGRDQNVDGKKILERMCGETGGRVFEVTKKQTVAAIYAQIGEELRAQYRLGFSPHAEASAEGYHPITLALTGAPAKSKLTIQTRDGYYTGK